MTTFVLSHNLQVSSTEVPALSAEQIASGLLKHSDCIAEAQPLQHPHWRVSVTSDHSSQELAADLVRAWRKLRASLGHGADYELLALGGRKDSAGAPGSPLQQGGWGVDVVETIDGDRFLQGINWEGLIQGRPDDGVFDVRG